RAQGGCGLPARERDSVRVRRQPLLPRSAGHDDAPYELRLRDAPQVVAALKYLEEKGGVPVEHGYTHQWDGGRNPYDGVTGDDVEFFRVTEDENGRLRDLGPLPGDTSTAWTDYRLVAAQREFAAAGLDPPKIFE